MGMEVDGDGEMRVGACWEVLASRCGLSSLVARRPKRSGDGKSDVFTGAGDGGLGTGSFLKVSKYCLGGHDSTLDSFVSMNVEAGLSTIGASSATATATGSSF